VAIRSDNALFTFDSLGVFNQIYSSSSATDTTWRWKRVSAWEGGHIMAIKTNGELWGWGINTYGEIGDGTIINRSAPVKIGTDRTWMDVSAGGNHTIATKTNGSVWTWGLNSSGQLGTGDNLNHTKPWQIYF
jgi:alpha-tubulin suppressor-like RCC1 family protein